MNIKKNMLRYEKSLSKYATFDKDAKGNFVLDMTKLKADYENNFDRLKNKGTRYQYTFVKNGLTYVLEKYDFVHICYIQYISNINV